MAAKFWFVQPNLRTESYIETDNFPSLELSQIYKFLRLKTQLVIGESSQKSETNNSSELNNLEFHQDYEIRPISNGFCNMDKNYDIITGKNRRLFSATQENSICCCFRKEYENLVMFDLNQIPLLQIEKTELSGYISKKLSFTVCTCETKLGTISRIDGFLEKPKYLVKDGQDEALFTLLIGSASDLHEPHYVVGKKGKTAFIQKKQNDGAYQIKIYHQCSTEEKALLLSLVMIMDLVKNKE